jgi:homopolymeric O-antigen transport system permease protein
MLMRPEAITAAAGQTAVAAQSGDRAPSFSHDAAEPRRYARALADLSVGLRRWRLAAALARLDIRNRYRGSVLGPFWLTLSTGLMLAGLGILYSALLHQTLKSYLPFLSVSIIVWNLISQVVTDASTSLISAEGMIRQLPLPYTTHALRCVFRNVIIAAHNLPLIAIVMVISAVLPGPGVVLALVGLAILGINAFTAALLLGMLCARFRDLGQIVGSVMQLAFFLTPILWQPASLGPKAVWLLLDPFYPIMEVVRGPLLGTGVSPLMWLLAVAYTAAFGAASFVFFVRFRGRIAFWV